MKIIGLMSGTSLDGLDVAYCEFFRSADGAVQGEECAQQEVLYGQHYGDFLRLAGKNLFCNVYAATTYPYPASWRERLATLHKASAWEYALADVELGHLFGRNVVDFLNNHYGTVDLVASHGHTVFHQPAKGVTTQIGSGNALAAETGLPVVCNFRALDVALGGQGAPLVPLGDRLLFGEYDACLNLGGIANISYEAEGRREAFDVSPCNMALNFLAQREGLEYDRGGALARCGRADEALLALLQGLPYYRQSLPKTLGKEWFEAQLQPLLEASVLPTADLLCTLTEHIALQLAAVIRHASLRHVVATGGGAYNSYLIERLRALVPQCEIIVPHKLLVEFKEAILFALLGFLRMEGQANVLRSVTGARSNSVTGDLVGHAVLCEREML